MNSRNYNRKVALSTALIAVALLTTACFNSADKQASSIFDADQTVDAGTPASTPEGWRRVRSMDGATAFAIPTDWKVTDYGDLYKDAPNLAEKIDLKNETFDSIDEVAPTAIYTVSFDSEGSTVEQLWEEGTVDKTINEEIILSGIRGKIGKCGGLLYEECVFLVHGGQAYAIRARAAQLTSNGDLPLTELDKEVQDIVKTLTFLK